MSTLKHLQLRDQSGAAAVELAVVLVLLVTILGGIIDYGRYRNYQLSLHHAVREGARAYALSTDGATGEGAADAAWTLSSATPTFTAASGDPCIPGDPATLEGSVDFAFITFVGTDRTITAEGVMRCGG